MTNYGWDVFPNLFRTDSYIEKEFSHRPLFHTTMHTQLEKLIPLLESYGYAFQSINYKTHSVTMYRDSTKLIVYPTRKGYTVASCLTHPWLGRTQLIRRRVCGEELLQILHNPRVHLGKGYHVKKRLRKSRRKPRFLS